jgi:hypothetical protein
MSRRRDPATTGIVTLPWQRTQTNARAAATSNISNAAFGSMDRHTKEFATTNRREN